MGLIKNVVQGTTGTKEYFNAKQFNSSGVRVAKDLTGYTITIYIYNEERTAKIVDGEACAIEGSAGNGVLSYTTSTASTATALRYLGRIKYVKSGEVDWSKEFVWNVEKNGAL